MRALLPLVLLILPGALRAVDLGDRFELAGFQVGLDGRRVVTKMTLAPGLPSDLLERIQSGLPTGLRYQFRLYRDHIRWFDNAIDESNLHVVAMYNAVTREYLVNYKFNGKLTESRVVKTTEELEQAMTRFDGLPIFTLSAIPSDWRLLVRARADLGSRIIFGFVPTAVTTEWTESRKFQPPG